MNLLIITQKVDLDDDNLGFFHQWLEKLSRKTDKLFVICLFKGRYNLSGNVEVFSLAKEKGMPKIGQWFLLQKHLLKCLPHTNGVFIHMCPIYAILSYPLVKIFQQKLVMWYAHAKAHFLAKIAEGLVDKILTPSADSFQYKQRKVLITGHGIDVDIFKPLETAGPGKEKFVVFTAGRVAPSKDPKTLIEAADNLVNQKGIKNLEVKIAGTPREEDGERYFEELKKLVADRNLINNVFFLGGLANKDLVKFYQESDVFVNLQPGGGAGKAVLEAMACAAPVVLCTPTFNDLLGDFKNQIIFKDHNPQDLAEKLLNVINFSAEKKSEFQRLLRNIVVEHHNLNNLVNRIMGVFGT